MSNTIVDVSVRNFGNWSAECCTVLADGFNTRYRDRGFVELQARQLDKDEGNGVSLSFSDNLFDFSGDYLPIELEGENLKVFIDYLTKCYNKMRENDEH